MTNAYSASKHAVNAMTDGMRQELGGRNIRVMHPDAGRDRDRGRRRHHQSRLAQGDRRRMSARKARSRPSEIGETHRLHAVDAAQREHFGDLGPADDRHHGLSTQASTGEKNMAGRLEGKIAVITGAGSGMGKAMAEAVHRRGREGGARRHQRQAGGGRRGDQCGGRRGGANEVRAVAVHCDVSNEDDVQDMIATAEEKFGRLDILCNNAGFGGRWRRCTNRPGDLGPGPRDQYQGRVPRHEIRHHLDAEDRRRRDRQHGLGLGRDRLEAPQRLWRGQGRGAPADQDRRARLSDQNIRVNAIAPGHDVDRAGRGLARPIAEPPAGISDARRHSARTAGAWPGTSPMPRCILASDEAAYVTGVILPVDGGYCIGFSGMGAENRRHDDGQHRRQLRFGTKARSS